MYGWHFLSAHSCSWTAFYQRCVLSKLQTDLGEGRATISRGWACYLSHGRTFYITPGLQAKGYSSFLSNTLCLSASTPGFLKRDHLLVFFRGGIQKTKRSKAVNANRNERWEEARRLLSDLFGIDQILRQGFRRKPLYSEEDDLNLSFLLSTRLSRSHLQYIPDGEFFKEMQTCNGSYGGYSPPATVLCHHSSKYQIQLSDRRQLVKGQIL
eukprot:TRINITY_DN3820_c0_g4_i1.p1 TRINITY_DN3820_c0_g4~~TRINITY_DN3820_c0_g4_i1.p1  ORF type:complete len:211 (-),score=8.91 TRINITY_DN3820_c0_g4_i1:175-807(-)